MMPSDTAVRFESNLLLRVLNEPERDLLRPHLEPVSYAKGAILYEDGAPITHVTFPCELTVATLAITTSDGRSVETATIGNEGAVGCVGSYGILPASTHAIVQIGGPMLRVASEALHDARQRSPQLRDLFGLYADCLLAQMLQSTACNALHPIEQRCLRRLQSLHDRLGNPVLPITHELLAAMLGVQRSYLTRILKVLQNQGLIKIGRGRITILDRARIDSVACGCHARVKDHYRTVLGALYRRSGRDHIGYRTAVEMVRGSS